MCWRDRLHAALAPPSGPECPDANCANSAKCPREAPASDQLAQSAQLALERFAGNGTPAPVGALPLTARDAGREAPAPPPEQAAGGAADREAIAGEMPLPTDRAAGQLGADLPHDAGREAPAPPPDVVEELALAMTALMLANPVFAGTTREAALAFNRAQARRRLTLPHDPIVRRLLPGWSGRDAKPAPL